MEKHGSWFLLLRTYMKSKFMGGGDKNPSSSLKTPRACHTLYHFIRFSCGSFPALFLLKLPFLVILFHFLSFCLHYADAFSCKRRVQETQLYPLLGRNSIGKRCCYLPGNRTPTPGARLPGSPIPSRNVSKELALNTGVCRERPRGPPLHFLSSSLCQALS